MSDYAPRKIVSVDKAASMPSTLAPGLFEICVRLDGVPSAVWQATFNSLWRAAIYMHKRPAEARGGAIYITAPVDGFQEEQAPELKKIVDDTNVALVQMENDRTSMLQRAEDKRQQEAAALSKLDNIRF